MAHTICPARHIDGQDEVFDDTERSRIGIHTCPGGGHNATHSADVDYAELLPDLFRMNAGRFYIQMASETDKARVLDIIQRERQASEIVRERALEAAEFLNGERFATTDDCGFSLFSDDLAMARATAFTKIKSRIDGKTSYGALLFAATGTKNS